MNLEPTTLYAEMIEAAKVYTFYFRGTFFSCDNDYPEWIRRLKINLEFLAAQYRLALRKAREQGRVGQRGLWF